VNFFACPSADELSRCITGKKCRADGSTGCFIADAGGNHIGKVYGESLIDALERTVQEQADHDIIDDYRRVEKDVDEKRKLLREKKKAQDALAVTDGVITFKYIENVADIPNSVLSENGGLTEETSATINSISDLYSLVKECGKGFRRK